VAGRPPASAAAHPVGGPRCVDGKPRWGNQTPGGSNKLPPDRPGNEGARAKLRSQTFVGIGDAMANQWGAAIHPDYDEIDRFLGLPIAI
jgi:hypothetical protein